MKYQEVNGEKIQEILQQTYKYMPTIIVVDGSSARVVAQINGTVYYTREKF